MPKKTALGHVMHGVNVCLRTVGVTMSKLPERGSLERAIRDALTKFNVQVVIDVGAHHGEFGGMLRSHGYRGRIISFEPSEEAFQLVKRACHADERWEVHRMCLGNEEGEVQIKRFHATDLNSLHTPTQTSRSGEKWGASLQPSGTELVPIRKLDNVLQELGVSDVDLCLKIDTQGHDLEVIAGAKQTLKHTWMVLTEMSVVRLYEGVPRMEESLAALRAESFLPVGFFPVVSGSGGVVLEFDCLLLNSDRSFKDA